MSDTTAADALASGAAVLGIELGSTRIKACLVDPARGHEVVATGSHAWENQFTDRLWTYPLEDVWAGLQSAVADSSPTPRPGTASVPPQSPPSASPR